MSGMKSWSVTPANNVLANTGFTMDEGQAPSTVNDSVRQLMADVRTEWAQGASIASAATVDLSTSTGGYVTITGSTGPITSFGTVSAGIRRRLLFTGTPTITYNATSMITPIAASIVVVAGDTCEVMSEGSGNWRILWYAGQTVQTTAIGFPATQLPSTNVNTLDDYEEGTWTPALAFGGGTTGITYGTQAGGYTKVGNRIDAWFRIVLTSKGSSTGAASITGLPFTIANTNEASGATCTLNFANMTTSVVGMIAAAGTTINTTTVAILHLAAAGTIYAATQNTDVSNTFTALGNLTYHA